MKSKLTKELLKFSSENLMPSVPDTRRFLELLAVVFTALGKFIFMDLLDYRLFYVVFAILCWSLYILARCKKEKDVLKYWGFRFDNFKETLMMILPFGILAIISFLVIGYNQGTINLSWHIFPILITYPLWGVMQQFLTIGLIAGNLNHLKSVKINKVLIIIFTAVLFSIVHYPSLWLMIGTFFLAIFYGIVYLKNNNLYVMGLFHGWLGAFFYYTVLDEDPFKDVFLKLFL